MRTKSAIPAVAALFLAISAAAASAQETRDTMRLPAELRAQRAAMNSALTKLDGVSAAALFADDGAVDFGGTVYTGREAVTGWFVEVLGGLASLRFDNASFVIGDNEVTERASYTAMTPEGEAPGTSETVWRKQENGEWRVAKLVVL